MLLWELSREVDGCTILIKPIKDWGRFNCRVYVWIYWNNDLFCCYILNTFLISLCFSDGPYTHNYCIVCRHTVSSLSSLQGDAACLVRQLPSAGRTYNPKAETRTGCYSSDELSDRMGCHKQLTRLPAWPQSTHDPRDNDAHVQRLWPFLYLDPHPRHEHRRSVCVFSQYTLD